MIQPWLDLYSKAIQRDSQTHWFSFINICSYPAQKTAYAKLPSDLWNVCSHHCGMSVNQNHSEPTDLCNLIIVSILLRPDISIYGNTFTFRKRQEIGDVARCCETLQERTLHFWGKKETESLTKETETTVYKEKAQLYKEFPWDSK